MDTQQFFQHLWEDYVKMTPQAGKIHRFFSEKGENVLNDHVAFRTFNQHPISGSDLEPHFLSLGYLKQETYQFPEKKLEAVSYAHPNHEFPLIFCSQLKVEELSIKAQKIIKKLCKGIDPEQVKKPEVFWAGRLWKTPSIEEYQVLVTESEYAGWLAAIGLRVNHFTVAVHRLKFFQSIDAVLRAVEKLDLSVNDSGGRVKGSPMELLEQGSTMADLIDMEFSDGTRIKIPSCYYEFAKRYKDASGDYFLGFIAASANKIFESTDNKTR